MHSKSIYLFFALFCFSLTACKRASTIAAPDKRAAAVQSSVAPGTVLIEPQFADAEQFHDGLAKVKVGTVAESVAGYIDQSGKFAINPKYVFSKDFSEGLAPVSSPNDEKVNMGFIDNTGKYAIEPQFVSADGFVDGTAIVAIGNRPPGTMGLINKAGQFVINPQYSWLWRLGQNRFSYRVSGFDEPEGLLDGQGRVVAAPQFTNLSGMSEGLIAASFGKAEAERCGYIDLNAKIVINPQFIRCQAFSEGLAAVVYDKGGQRGYAYIDRRGNVAFRVPYQEVRAFSDGLAAVVVGTSKETAKWGFIDKRGAMVVTPQFDEVYSFKDGRAVVRVGGGYGNQAMSENRNLYDQHHKVVTGKWGAIDTSGSYVVNPRFDLMTGATSRLAPIRVGNHLTGKWGFVQL